MRIAGTDVARGRTIGRYIVLDRLGSGAMGMVYCAYDPELARQVALKVVRPKCDADRDLAAGRARLLREAQALAKLSHPNVVAVYDVGTGGDDVFLAMELVRGDNLRAWLGKRSAHWREVVRVFVDAGRGLAAAHQLGLVHRDFKPENVLVAETGRVCVTDFGLARPDASVEASASASDTASMESVESHLRSGALGATPTLDGEAVGTPAYMAPEQHGANEADARCDQYAFCVALYEAVYGRRPFDGDSEKELAHAKTTVAPQFPAHQLGDKSTHVPAFIRRVLMRGLSRAARRRYDTMDALLAELERGSARPSWPVVAVGVGAVTLLAVGVLSQPGESARVDPCAGAGIEPTQAWDDQAQGAVQRGIGAAAGPDDTTFFRVAPKLDGLVDGWRAAHKATCEDTWVRGAQSAELLDARMLCLDGQWSEIVAVTEILADADPAVVERAVALVDALRDPAHCRAWVPTALSDVPPSGEARDQYERIAVSLRRTRALRHAGKTEQAVALLASVAEDIDRLGIGSLRAELLVLRGALQHDRGDAASGTEALQEAIALSRAAGARRLEAEAWMRLSETAGVDGHDPARERFYARMGASVAASIGGDVEVDAWAESKLGALGPDHAAAADSAANLGLLAVTRGDAARAVALYERGARLMAKSRPADHRDMARMHDGLGQALLLAGDLVRAQDELLLAQAIYSASYGPRHSTVGLVLGRLGEVALERGDAPRAEALLREAMSIHVEQSGDRIDGAAVRIKLAAALAGSAPESAEIESLLAEARQALEDRPVEALTAQIGALEAERVSGP